LTRAIAANKAVKPRMSLSGRAVVSDACYQAMTGSQLFVIEPEGYGKQFSSKKNGQQTSASKQRCQE